MRIYTYVTSLNSVHAARKAAKESFLGGLIPAGIGGGIILLTALGLAGYVGPVAGHPEIGYWGNMLVGASFLFVASTFWEQAVRFYRWR
jgi:hypothetical protein